MSAFPHNFFKERKMKSLIWMMFFALSTPTVVWAHELLEESPEELTCGVEDQTFFTIFATESAPVWGPFISNLKRCAPGCQPVNYNAYRSQRNSCHYSGRALDVGAIRCDGKVYHAISGGKYASMVQCMKGRMKKVLYRNGPGRTSGHNDHAHFSLGCSIPGRPVYW